MTQADQVVAPGQTEPAGQAGRSRRWLPPVAAASVLAVVLAAYVADVVTHGSVMIAMRDLAVYQDGGLIARHSSPVWHSGESLYSWTGQNGVSFTYSPFAAVVFAVASLLPWTLLRWVMTVLSLGALAASAWLVFGKLGYTGRRARLTATLLLCAAVLFTEPVQQTLGLGQINLILMLLVTLDLMHSGRRWWSGIGIGVAAGIKLVPLIFIPYLVLTGRFRQAATATVTFLATIGLGYAVLPHDSARYWQHGLFLNANRIVFLGTRGNQSLRGIVTRFDGSVAGAVHPWLVVAIVVAVIGLLASASLYHAGHQVAGMLGCALTGLLVSPLSWDHHWVWATIGIGLLAHYAVRARGWRRIAWAAAAAVLWATFASWPQWWDSSQALTPAGWVWYGPTQYFAYGDNPAYHEYHWNALQILAGNSFVWAGLLALAGLAVAAVVVRRPAIDQFGRAQRRSRQLLHLP